MTRSVCVSDRQTDRQTGRQTDRQTDRHNLAQSRGERTRTRHRKFMLAGLICAPPSRTILLHILSIFYKPSSPQSIAADSSRPMIIFKIKCYDVYRDIMTHDLFAQCTYQLINYYLDAPDSKALICMSTLNSAVRLSMFAYYPFVI